MRTVRDILIPRGGRLLLIIITAVVIIVSISKATRFINESASTDLLCRTIGARLFHAGKSAYFYKWKAGDDPAFLNPNDPPARRVNGNVVTPAMLKLFYGISFFSYPVVKMIWASLQYLFLFLTIFFLAGKGKPTGRIPLLAVVIVLLLYLCSNIWFYNIERGQVYSFYLLLLSMIYYCYERNWPPGRFAAGFINGISIFFRPLMVFFAIPFLLKKDGRFFAGCCCGGLLALCLFFLPATGQWKDYSFAMKEYSAETLTEQPVPVTTNGLPVAGSPGGMQQVQVFSCGGIKTLQAYFSRAGFLLQPLTLLGAYAVLVITCCFVYRQAIPAPACGNRDFLFAFFLYILSELFIVGNRAGYNQLQWLFAICLLLQQKRIPAGVLVALAAAFIAGNVRFTTLPSQFALAELVLYAVLLYSIATFSRKQSLPIA